MKVRSVVALTIKVPLQPFSGEVLKLVSPSCKRFETQFYINVEEILNKYIPTMVHFRILG